MPPFTAAGLPESLPDDVTAEIKVGDRIAAYFEAIYLAGFRRAERAHGEPGGLSARLATDLSRLLPAAPAVSQKAFLERFRALAAGSAGG